jgi:hypothetical protein
VRLPEGIIKSDDISPTTQWEYMLYLTFTPLNPPGKALASRMGKKSRADLRSIKDQIIASGDVKKVVQIE